MLTDDELVKLYETGNNDAFKILLDRCKDQVYNHIYMIIRQRELTEDIFQETFIKAITCIRQKRYVYTGHFIPWINRIAYNLIIDYFRKEKNENTISNDSMDYDLLNNSDLCERSVESTIINEQILMDVVHLIKYLPENQQIVIRMRFFENLSFKEIADNTGVSINTALGRMRYAILNMRRLALEYNLSLEIK